jgi:predicted DNA-binding transcriptional regulator AlpA
MSVAPETPTARKLISKRELLQLVPLSYPTIWGMMRAGNFPRSVKITDGPNAKAAWYEDEVVAWQASRSRTELKPVAEAEAA